MKRAVHMLFIFAVVLSGFAGVLTITPSSTAQYTPHDPIYIEGDDDFAEQAANESWPGDGTEGNPYIIEGYDINASKDDGIEIRSTTVHFIIKESRIRDGNNGHNNGIRLRYVQNGTISDCLITNNYCGIVLSGSKGNKIVDNWLHSNEDYDIIILGSTAISLTNNKMKDRGIFISGYQIEYWVTNDIDTTNTVNGKPIYYWENKTGNTVPSGAGQVILINCSEIIIENQEITDVNCGIQLAFSLNNTIKNNVISNQDYGIELINSSGNSLIGNKILSNKWFGILLSSSNDNNISDNTISGKWYGISMVSSTNNTVMNNTMFEAGLELNGWFLEHWGSHHIDTSNTVNGKPLYYLKDKSGGTVPLGAGQINIINCTDIIVEDQEISNCTIAIDISYSKNITIKNNKVSYNKVTGIGLSHTNESIVENNNASKNTINGITLSYSFSCHIRNNTVFFNQDGIDLWQSAGNTVYSNDIFDNGYGIAFRSSSSGNNVLWNNIIENNFGVSIYSSGDNNIIDNDIKNNRKGIRVTESHWNTITNNNISNQRSYGINIEFSNNNTISNNIILYNRRGFYLDSSEGNTITNNNISYNFDGIFCIRIFILNISHNIVNSSNTTGIFISSSPMVDIIGNTVSFNNNRGIDIYNSTQNNISLNTVTHNFVGIEMEGSSENTIMGNIASFNEVDGINLQISTGNNVTNNVATNNHDGIDLHTVNESILMNNHCVNNEHEGIVLENSSGNIIIWNNISDNQLGLFLGSTHNNVLHHNLFINNIQQIYREGNNDNVWDDGNFEGNYWDDYTGFDTDADGVGDTKLPHHGVDHYPLTDRQGSVHSESLYFWVVFITILIIAVILITLILKKRKKEGPPSDENEGMPKYQI